MAEKTYRIGEAAAKLNLKTYVLRFWEMEFPQIEPIRTEKGQRLYTESDLAVLGRIKYLLHERGLTIEGARRLLREEAERGVTYAEGDASFPGLADELPETETDDEGYGAYAPAESPVQASLFPAACGSVPPPVSDLPHIVAELEAIRDMLTF